MIKKVLFVSHKRAQCGVYAFGKNITDVLQHSARYAFTRVECSSLGELERAIAEHAPAAIIYNYCQPVLPWVAERIVPKIYKSNIAGLRIPQIGIIHEVTQQLADTAINYRKRLLCSALTPLINSLFDFYIAPDPTLLLRNPLVYKTGRLVPAYKNTFALPTKPVIGSFGFGTPKKGFEEIVRAVQREYDEAVIRFNIPAADYGDPDGRNARLIAARCKSLITKPGIALQATHDFLDDGALLDFLAQNTANVFWYTNNGGRGLSSTVENAMAVQRPIAVSKDVMFRHVLDVEPSICVERNSLKTIIQNGFTPLQQHYSEWSPGILLWEYERIMDSIFGKLQRQPGSEGVVRKLRSSARRLLSMPQETFTWLRDSEQATDDDLRIDRSVRYEPLRVPAGASLNRILDDSARQLYAPAIDTLTKLVPRTMAKKIARANVQQGFVFDTVFRYLPQYPNPKLLCVGCYEDTASMSLKKLGYAVEEVDPMLNYYLQEYFNKPTTVKGSYNIIFSTSVIEHDPDDESFIRCISDLLAPGGVAVLTCDYQDGWKPGQPKPECDARFYTQQDLKVRLLSQMKGCQLVDKPQWDCPNPDFLLAGKYRYTFATFVVQKARRTIEG